jgi:hypothetical protein
MDELTLRATLLTFLERLIFMGKNRARILAMGVLLFLGITSVLGALPLLRDPYGSPLSMPQSFLTHSPFHSFLVPGIVLLVCNGLLSFFIFVAVFRRQKFYGRWVFAQGMILAGWLLVEIAVLRFVVWPQWLYGGVACLLLVCGLWLRHEGGEANKVKEKRQSN